MIEGLKRCRMEEHEVESLEQLQEWMLHVLQTIT